ELIRHRGERGGRALQHQRLAGADENVQGAVAVGGGGDAHQLGEIRYQSIALIEQLVGLLTGRRYAAAHDLLVQVGDLRTDRVDLLNVGRDARIDVRIQPIEPGAGGVQIA